MIRNPIATMMPPTTMSSATPFSRSPLHDANY